MSQLQSEDFWILLVPILLLAVTLGILAAKYKRDVRNLQQRILVLEQKVK